VAAIHPDLTWHFGPGVAAEHRLTVSAGGVAAVRPAAERWLRAAPAPDKTWEYRASQEADPDALASTLEIAGHEVDLSLTRFRVDPVEEELRVHVGVYHPAFAEMSGDVRDRITFLLLDWILGEDDVERWLGHIEPLQVPPAAVASAEELRAAVDSMAQSRSPDTWSLAQWLDKDGLPGLAVVRRGLRWIDHPTLDRHHVLTRSYTAQENGQPLDSSTLDELHSVEVDLESAIGRQAVLVGHETHAGARRFHVYSDGEDQNVDATLGNFATSHGLSVEARADPAWTDVRHLTG